jgi:hypothetical protein
MTSERMLLLDLPTGRVTTTYSQRVQRCYHAESFLFLEYMLLYKDCMHLLLAK